MGQKILIMMLYYERPALVREALRSIVRNNNNYGKWHLAFHDDGSPTPGEPIVRDIFTEEMLEKTTFYKTYATKEQKFASGGMLGVVMNQMIRDSDADIAFMLCDDDVLHPYYLNNLNRYFNKHPEESACYCHVVTFDPTKETWEKATNYDNPLNNYKLAINPSGNLDASQVAWKTSINKECNVWFPYPCIKNHDAVFYQKLYDSVGAINFGGFVGQYKAIHAEQLSQQGQSDNVDEIVNDAHKAAKIKFLNRDFRGAETMYKQILRVNPDDHDADDMIRIIKSVMKR